MGCAVLAGRSLSDLLYGVAPTDLATYGGAILVVAVLALGGCLVPALRASAGDAAKALGEK